MDLDEVNFINVPYQKLFAYLYNLEKINGIQFLKVAKSLTKNQMIKSRCESLYLRYGRSRYIGNFYVYI